jgi:hypothetical protein
VIPTATVPAITHGVSQPCPEHPNTSCIAMNLRLRQRSRASSATPPSTTNYGALEDLHAMLTEHGDWMPLGVADEQKPAAEGTVEAWGRADSNPVGGWYGTEKGPRGRFGMYVPPLLKRLGLAELEHDPRNNRMRAI